MSNLKEKKLLVVSQNYATFVKDQLDCIAGEWKHVHVLPVYRPIAELSNFLPIDSLKPFRKKEKINLTNLPDNLTVFPTAVNYLPFNSMYKTVGEKHEKAVKRVIEKKGLEFDCIHCHFSYSSGYVGMRLKQKYNIPLIVTVHGFDIYDLPFRDQFWQKRITAVLGQADRIITVSKKNNEYIKKLNISTPVTIIPNGYDPDIFYPLSKKEARDKLKLPQDKTILVSVGNLIKIKGHDFLIDTINSLVSSNRQICCYIIGTGDQRKSLQGKINQLGLQEHVTLIGRKDHAEINLWINSCDLFVLPSLNEGNPTVLFECLGCGIPFVGSKVGGVPEIINKDTLGVLFQPGDQQGIQNSLQQALEMEWNRQFILQEARKYSWKSLANRIIKVYQHALSNSHPLST